MSLELFEMSKNIITHPVTMSLAAYMLTSLGMAIYHVPRAEQGIAAPTESEKKIMRQCQSKLRIAG